MCLSGLSTATTNANNEKFLKWLEKIICAHSVLTAFVRAQNITTKKTRMVSSTVIKNFIITSWVPFVKGQNGTTWFLGKPFIDVHQNNALVQSTIPIKTLPAKNIVCVSHPSFSSDLVPCDFFLSPKNKTALRGKNFEAVRTLNANNYCVQRKKWSLYQLTNEENIELVQLYFNYISPCINGNSLPSWFPSTQIRLKVFELSSIESVH